MPATLIEKIIAAHAEEDHVSPGDIVDLAIDARVARDFGGANVVKNLEDADLGIADPARTFFTFDCNPGGSDQRYAANQQRCRIFAAQHDVRVYDIDQGIGTHLAIEEGLIGPGSTFVSTDSHANIMGAIGAFGQGMGDADIAGAFAFGKVWFKVPRTLRVVFEGTPGSDAAAKDLILAALATIGSSGLLGFAAELCGEAVESLGLSERITLASMATEMGGIIALIPPDERIVAYCRERAAFDFDPQYPDRNAPCEREVTVDVDGLTPRLARPGHPDDVIAVDALPSTRVDSVFIGSCTNGRIEDLRAAATILRGCRVADGVVLKIVPATDRVWRQCLDEGLIEIFKTAGALVGNAGCGGCAAGQIGQNGPGEVTVSTGNRNFVGKQGQGEVYLASPATAAASAVAGVIVSAPRLAAGQLPPRPTRPMPAADRVGAAADAAPVDSEAQPIRFSGRAWVIDVADIDTDMIFHNRHLAETDPRKMGQHTFGNLEGWADFPRKVRPGDIVIAGENFGCGSSRQQAVACFRTLGVAAIVARSFGAIYERNAINDALPVVACPWPKGAIETGDELHIDLETGRVKNLTQNTELSAGPLSAVQLEIYRRGGLLRG